MIDNSSGYEGIANTVELSMRAVSITDTATVADDTAPSIDGVCVMIIDDQEDARELLMELAKAHGGEPQAFASGDDALAWLRDLSFERWPEVLICDVAMPEEDGYAVLHRLRRLEEERGTPLNKRISAIALTGHAQPEDRMRALMAGFQLHLSKPVDPIELLSAVARLAAHHVETY